MRRAAIILSLGVGLGMTMTACAAVDLSAGMRQLCSKTDRADFRFVPQRETSRDTVLATLAATADPLRLEQALVGIDPNARRGSTGITPLGAAAGFGNWRAVKALLDRGADIDRVSATGTTPLEYAVQNAKLPIACQLVERGATLPAPASRPAATTLLPSAALADDDQEATTFTTFLIERGYAVDARLMGDTALLIASEMGHRRLVELLLARGADKTLRNRQGETARQVAQRAGHTEIVRVLDSIPPGSR